MTVLGLSLGLLMAVPSAAVAQSSGINLTILYTGDTHGHLESFTADSDKPVGGVAKRAIFFQDKRRHTQITWLTLDSGDALSGTPMSDAYQGYLDIEAMNRLSYDAMTVGVHDFDYGLTVLKQRVKEAKFPVLSANLVDQESGQPIFQPYTIIERGGAKIAIFGLSTDEMADRVAPENFQGLKVLDPLETARALVPELRAKADIVVGLTHLGINSDIRIASKVPGIDVICGGMSHSELQVPMKVGSTLIVHDGYYGKTVGMLKLSFKPDTNGRLTRAYFDSQLEPMAGKWKENSDYLAWLGSFKPGLNERMSVVIGSSTSRMVALKAKSSETDMGNFVCDVLRDATDADAAILPAAFFKNGLPDGPVTLGDLFTALPYDHYAMVLNVTGGELQQILNDAADQIGRPGFPQVSGLNLALFNGQAYYIKVKGENIDSFAHYRIATSDAIAEGGLGYATMGTIKDRSYTGRLVRDLVKLRIKNGKPIQSAIYKRVSFIAEAPEGAAPAEDRTPEESSASPGMITSDETPTEGSDGSVADETVSDEAASDETADAGTPDENFVPDESVSEDTRLDRNGEPMNDGSGVEDEGVSDEGSDNSGSDETSSDEAASDEAGAEDHSLDGVVSEADGPGSESIGADETPAEEELTPEEEPAVSSAADGPIGEGSAEGNGLDYEFRVERVKGEYVFTLHVVNNGPSAVTLAYKSGEFFDFRVFNGNDLVWNFNHNHFFMQKQRVEPLGPGEFRDFRGKWNGKNNAGTRLTPGSYRFEAAHTLIENPVRVDFDAEL